MNDYILITFDGDDEPNPLSVVTNLFHFCLITPPAKTFGKLGLGSSVRLNFFIAFLFLSSVMGAHVGNTFSLARSHAGDFLFTGGEDGAIQMFEIINDCDEGDVVQVATWKAHSGSVNSLAFEFPWLVSASGDGKLALIDIRKLLSTTSRSCSRKKVSRVNNVEPPQRMLHGFECNLFSVAIGADRIVCGGEEGVVRIWNFSQALAIEQRARALRGIRLENRLRRRKLQIDMVSKSGRANRCLVAAKKNQISGNQSGVWHNKHEMSGELKGSQS
ncbi:hypothetical protein Ddye_022726 [Dipteronia dyeriana]|uniref:Uncharacterized protein n=1 Tax=Dipteronia dyeriana TaxID=168575 RepID=A0AAD9TS65_9ROSI|nr:hypothetical protein Ddye_022726 [Dipteronia dyeriana]